MRRRRYVPSDVRAMSNAQLKKQQKDKDLSRPSRCLAYGERMRRRIAA
jgi:hypothetical protein